MGELKDVFFIRTVPIFHIDWLWLNAVALGGRVCWDLSVLDCCVFTEERGEAGRA